MTAPFRNQMAPNTAPLLQLAVIVFVETYAVNRPWEIFLRRLIALECGMSLGIKIFTEPPRSFVTHESNKDSSSGSVDMP